MANIVNAEHVSIAFGTRILLDDVSLGIGQGQRIGLVGRNGAGKTTLMNLVAGRLQPDSGRISRNRDARIGLLDQRDHLGGVRLDPRAALELGKGDFCDCHYNS